MHGSHDLSGFVDQGAEGLADGIADKPGEAVSCVNVAQRSMEPFAPVVARLTGR